AEAGRTTMERKNQSKRAPGRASERFPGPIRPNTTLLSKRLFCGQQLPFDDGSDRLESLQERGLKSPDQRRLRSRGTAQAPTIAENSPNAVNRYDVPQDKLRGTKSRAGTQTLRNAPLHQLDEIELHRIGHIHADFRSHAGIGQIRHEGREGTSDFRKDFHKST